MTDAFGNLKLACLHQLTTRVVVIPARWRTAVVYDSLIDDGLAAPVVNVNPLQRGYQITPAGREYYASQSPQ